MFRAYYRITSHFQYIHLWNTGEQTQLWHTSSAEENKSTTSVLHPLICIGRIWSGTIFLQVVHWALGMFSNSFASGGNGILSSSSCRGEMYNVYFPFPLTAFSCWPVYPCRSGGITTKLRRPPPPKIENWWGCTHIEYLETTLIQCMCLRTCGLVQHPATTDICQSWICTQKQIWKLKRQNNS